jgi:uncharacterized protein (TIGR00251 family)
MCSVELTADRDSVLLPVHAQPGARRNGIVGVHAGRLKVAVTQAPEKGKANDAIIEVLAEGLSLKRSQISLASGPTNSRKVFRVRDLMVDELAERIASCLG